MWRQRSRVTFLREGDRNTKWFQRKATWRKKKNDITKLKDSSGVWIEDKKGLEEMTNCFFKKLYEKDDRAAPHEIMELFQTTVTQGMNESLTKPFSASEISNALFQIGPLKAPGPDGFPARFYQRNWATIKEDVIKVVQDFF